MSEERDCPQPSTLAERSRRRRQRIVGHSSSSFEEAELWDLEFWQRRSPQERLSALVAIHRDVEMVPAARRVGTGAGTGEDR